MSTSGRSPRRGPVAGPISRLLAGPHVALPRPLDALAESWAGLPPRARAGLVLLALAALLVVTQVRVRQVEARWGGRPVAVLVADDDLAVGGSPAGLRRMELPPAAVPPGAVRDPAPEAVLALALPRGSVLTHAHLDARGPAAGLAEELRAVPLPIEDGWGVAAGGWVDVWVLGAGGDPAELVASSRPVLEVRGEGPRSTALVGLHVDEVGPTTAGLALGGVLLAHAPPP